MVLAVQGGVASETLDQIQARLSEAQASDEARLAAIERGRALAGQCSECHGMDGNSSDPKVPNLADQNPVYLMDQFAKYRHGQRQDFTGVMQKQVQALSTDELIDLAVYYAVSTLKPAQGDRTLETKGERLYNERCVPCHGADGRGKEGYARIAGQHPLYVMQTLGLFHDQSSNIWRARESATMHDVVKDLTETEINALAAYVANLYAKPLLMQHGHRPAGEGSRDADPVRFGPHSPR